MKDTRERVVIVGGSDGIGLASAICLAEAGYDLIIAGRSKEKLDAAVDEIPGRVTTYSMDFTDEGEVVAFFSECDTLDHLVIAAGGAPLVGSFLNIDSVAFKKYFDNKFWGVYHTARYGVPHVSKSGSIIFFIGSAGRAAFPGSTALAAVNGAIQTMARTLAKELAPVRVNVVSPGIIKTHVYDAMSETARRGLYDYAVNSQLVKRLGQPEDVAQAVLFLITNSFITGAVIDVDGGDRL